MSTIEEIVKVEREAEAQLKAAQAEAEAIKRNGKLEAEKIVAEARTKKADYEKSFLESVENKLKISADKNRKNLESKLKKREKVFQEKAQETVEWLLDEIIRNP